MQYALVTIKIAPTCEVDALDISYRQQGAAIQLLDWRSRDRGAERRELRGYGTCNRRHCSYQGKAHGSSNQAIFNGGCAGFVFEKLVHFETPELIDITVHLT